MSLVDDTRYNFERTRYRQMWKREQVFAKMLGEFRGNAADFLEIVRAKVRDPAVGTHSDEPGFNFGQY